ncbi:hypothetical protein KIPB_002096 [Kipferlia bialata]|uniref:Uncharacterized protein n=1 Tax=Kipferlia bialata TaxID=797122 RepID=A0A9K3GEP0_9EUKA|nr:hypothetical protein KIPB_002096 [Kipferlia bialata]|eukprot:g2096.t1
MQSTVPTVQHEGDIYIHGGDTYDAYLQRHQGQTCVAYDISYINRGLYLSQRALGLLREHNAKYPNENPTELTQKEAKEMEEKERYMGEEWSLETSQETREQHEKWQQECRAEAKMDGRKYRFDPFLGWLVHTLPRGACNSEVEAMIPLRDALTDGRPSEIQIKWLDVPSPWCVNIRSHSGRESVRPNDARRLLMQIAGPVNDPSLTDAERVEAVRRGVAEYREGNPGHSASGY